MPIKLDKIDIALLESLIKDGRKSFNQVSREIKVSTPTVKARYDRLVNAGLIKAVTLDLDIGKLEAKTGKKLGHLREKTIKSHGIKLGKGMIIELSCDYCQGSVDGKPHVLKFGNFERFFCCTSCRSLYKEKYKTRIESLK
ncbi:MAG: winged helix-turn-helix transcriptional regulator [Nitrosotalea sp.]